MILDAIGNVIDKEHYITTSDPDDLFGSLAEGFYRKLLVNLNESEVKKHFNSKAILNHSCQSQRLQLIQNSSDRQLLVITQD